MSKILDGIRSSNRTFLTLGSTSATEPREAACDGQIPRAYGDDAYDTIELMESAEDNIPLSEYQSVVDQIGPTTAAKFNAILEENKENVVYWRLDHRKIDARKGETADEFLASFCAS